MTSDSSGFLSPMSSRVRERREMKAGLTDAKSLRCLTDVAFLWVINNLARDMSFAEFITFSVG